jgi:hypothetical protein
MPGNSRPSTTGETDTKSLGRDQTSKQTESKPFDGINYIIAIGIDTYQSPIVNDFNGNCVKDCKDLVELLTTRYINFQAYKEKAEDPHYLINENAKQHNILAKIKAFVRDSKVNNINNNLIIFYSGHGWEVKQGPSKIGCWIPHACKSADYDEVIPYDKLTPLIKRLDTQNFLFISDSCRSGQIFNEIRAVNNIANSETIEGKELSRFAIVSSRSDENSKAGKANQNSLFTGRLLETLRANWDQELLVSNIIAALDKTFISDDKQKPFSGRLNFNNAPNSGQYTFYIDKKFIEPEKKKFYLRTELETFNYDSQMDKFIEFKTSKYSSLITIIDGTPDDGLRLIARKAKSYDYFPAKNQETYFINPTYALTTPEQKTLNLLNAALQKEFKTMDDLTRHIRSILNASHLVLELRFFADAEKLPKQSKIDIINLVAEYISSILIAEKNPYKLFLFIVDEENSGYATIYTSDKISAVNAILIPPTDRVNDVKACNWYINVRKRSANAEEFAQFFDSTIFDQMEMIIQETNGYPGNFIRLICQRAGCNDLADEILNPK